MPLLMQFVQWSNSKQEVDLFFRDAQKNALRYPDEPVALEMLAEGALDAEDLGVAALANDTLIAKRPNNARALLRRARIAAVQTRKSAVPTGWPTVRKLIVKANRAAPNDPFALTEYYDTYLEEGIPAPEIAVDGLRRALQLVPQVSNVRMKLARRLVTDGKGVEARAVLVPLLNNPHSAEVREAARALLEAPSASDKVTTSNPNE